LVTGGKRGTLYKTCPGKWEKTMTAELMDVDELRKKVIDAKESLERARYRVDAIDLILEGVNDARTRGACQEVFALAAEKLDEVDDRLDTIYRDLSAIARLGRDRAPE
jgi:hypothetical protein